MMQPSRSMLKVSVLCCSIPAWYRCLKVLLGLNHLILEPELDQLLSLAWVDSDCMDSRVQRARQVGIEHKVHMVSSGGKDIENMFLTTTIKSTSNNFNFQFQL